MFDVFLLFCFVHSLLLQTTGLLHCRKRWNGLKKKVLTSWSPIVRLVCVNKYGCSPELAGKQLFQRDLISLRI